MVVLLRQILIALTVMAAPVLTPNSLTAAPIPVWAGPGPRACMGRCSLDWALASLSPERRAAVAAAMEAIPGGYSIPVRNGAVFEMMSYFVDGPHADLRHTVAALDADEPATGWQFDGWAFVRIVGCQNWAVMIDTPPGLVVSGTPDDAEVPASGPPEGGSVVTAAFPATSGQVELDSLFPPRVSPGAQTVPETGPETGSETGSGTGLTDEVIGPEPPIDMGGGGIDPDQPEGPISTVLLPDPDNPVPLPVPLPSSLSVALMALLAIGLWRGAIGGARTKASRG